MSYADSLLARDEQILYRARQHWLAPLSDARNAILVLLVGVVLALIEHQVLHWSQFIVYAGLLLALVGLIWIAIIFATWRAQGYFVTNRRVMKLEGLLDKKVADSSLDKINDAVLDQGILARMFHYGNLKILTANEDDVDQYQMLAHVVEFKKAMLNAKNALEDGYRGQSGPRVAAAPSAPSASDDVTSTLARLADLRDKGAITPAEYESKKAELLSRL